VDPADLLAPAGPVEAALFPGEGDGSNGTDLFARLSAYIDQAEVKAAEAAFLDPEAAARAWALHLSFEAAYTLAVSRPATENTMVQVLGSTTYTKDQRDGLKAKSNQYLAEFNRMLAQIPVGSPSGPQSRQSTNTFDW